MNEYSLTPVQEVDGLHIKRDDLYAPFGPGEVNGGKLRQCVMLVNSVKKDYKSLLTYCSIHSPQAPITAAVARANGMPCRIVYGGTTRESVAALPMPRLAMKYGASIVLAARSGRHSILHARAKELAAQENSFIVQYGINIIGYGDTLLTAVAAQTENLPDDIENLVMTCGSGITATGVMIGLHRYGKRVKRMEKYRFDKAIPIKIDDSGLGGGVTDRLRRVKREQPERFWWMDIIPVYFGQRIHHDFYYDSTTYMMSVVKNLLAPQTPEGAQKPVQLILPNDNDLVGQLSTRKYSMTDDAKIRVESKDAMKKRGMHSPDEADCILLLCLPVKPKRRGDVKK